MLGWQQRSHDGMQESPEDCLGHSEVGIRRSALLRSLKRSQPCLDFCLELRGASQIVTGWVYLSWAGRRCVVWQLYAIETVSTAAPLGLPLGHGWTRRHTICVVWCGSFDAQTWASIMR